MAEVDPAGEIVSACAGALVQALADGGQLPPGCTAEPLSVSFRFGELDGDGGGVFKATWNAGRSGVSVSRDPAA